MIETKAEVKTVIVVYSPQNVRPHGLKSKVTFSDTNFTLTLLPGQNIVAKDQFEKLKTHPDYQTYLGWEALEIIEASELNKVESPDSLLSYSLADQKRIIALCMDRLILQKYLGETRNPIVKSQIQLRITSVEQGR